MEYPALKQTCNPPGFGFVHRLVGLDSNESGSFSEDAATRRKQHSAIIVNYIIHYKIQ